MGALDVNGALPGEVKGRVISVNHPDIYPGEVARVVALFDHLSIAPVRSRLLAGRRASPTAIGGDLSVHLDQGFAMSAPTIRHQRGRAVAVRRTLLDLPP